MKRFLLLLLLASTAFAADAPRKLAFARNDNSIWVANLDGSAATKIASGVDPDISPDGAKVAYNTEGTTSARQIAIADTATGQSTIFKDIPSDNCFGPVWAPDGSKLAFYIFIKGIWDIGLVNADGTGFRILKAGDTDSHSYYSACWMPDGQSLYCQDLENLYHIGLDGSVIKQWPLQKLFTGGDMDSNMKFDVSPDGATLLVELNSGADHTPRGWDGPAPSIWAMDLATEKVRKLTPLFWWEPCWLSADDFLCISQGVKEKQPSIYRRSVDGKTHKLLIKNATDPTASK